VKRRVGVEMVVCRWQLDFLLYSSSFFGLLVGE